MVKTEELSIGLKVRKIDETHVKGIIHGIGVIGKKNWFKVLLTSGQLIIVQKPELWEIYRY